MHTFLMDIHSLNRWLVLIAALYALFVYGRGWFGRRSWTEQARRPGVIFTILLDTQVVLGVILYVIFSPITTQGFANVMGNPASRFFIMEHSVMMLLAVIFAHTGGILIKRAKPESKFKRAFLFYGIAFLIILAAIPWPFMPGYGRPWLF